MVKMESNLEFTISDFVSKTAVDNSPPKRRNRAKSAPEHPSQQLQNGSERQRGGVVEFADMNKRLDIGTLNTELTKKTLLYEKAEQEISLLNKKIENMRMEWRSQQEHLGKLHQDYTKLQHTIGQHSIYCATLGNY